jgi:hypothetical protein
LLERIGAVVAGRVAAVGALSTDVKLRLLVCIADEQLRSQNVQSSIFDNLVMKSEASRLAEFESAFASALEVIRVAHRGKVT